MTDAASPAPIESALLNEAAGGAVRHGYFTRAGGVSEGLYRGLNVGLGSNDDREKVMENRRRVAAWFGLPVERLASVHQVHSPEVVTIGPDYDGTRPAPVCVAKGKDLIALEIRRVAEENEVPVVENPPLARSLFDSVELEAEIPEHLYRAIAELLAFVYRTARRRTPIARAA